MAIGFASDKFEIHSALLSKLQGWILGNHAFQFLSTNDSDGFESLFFSGKSGCSNMV